MSLATKWNVPITNQGLGKGSGLFFRPLNMENMSRVGWMVPFLDAKTAHYLMNDKLV